jgi:hypothetical protein
VGRDLGVDRRWLWHTAVGHERQPEDDGAGSRTREVGEERGRRERAGRLPGGLAHRVGPAGSGEGGLTGGPEPGKEMKEKEKENRINSNLKLTLYIYSNFI